MAGVESSWRLAMSCDTEVAEGSVGLVAGVGIGNSIGSRCCVSLMEMTIFSRSMGAMCFSRDIRRLSWESARLNSGAESVGMVVAEVSSSSASSISSDDAESRLDESAGIGMSLVAAFGLSEIESGGESDERACRSGAQHNVSRFHNRQLRFSNRLPSSIACEVFENNDH